MGKVINEPTREGFEHGYHLSRFADAEEAKAPLANGRERCITCAFRCGTYPSGSPTTTMDALKCVIEGVPFMCHEDTRQICAGYALLRRSDPQRKTEVNWPFSDEVITDE
jgi:hypothetical protein